MSAPASVSFTPFGALEIEQPIPARFEQQVARHPGRSAVCMPGVELSYRELDARANRIAHGVLAERGDKEEPIALCLEQGPELVAAILAVLKAGKLYVALDPKLPPQRQRAVLDDSGAPLVLAEGAGRWQGCGTLDLRSLDATLPAHSPGLTLSPDRPAYLFYTSGSTGPPKGVVDCHRNVLHNVMRYTNSLELGPEDRLTLLQSCSFSGSVSSLFGALLNGATLLPCDPRGAGLAATAAQLLRAAPTVYHSVPALFRQLVAAAGGFPSLRVIRLEGDTTRAADVALFRECFGPGCVLVNGLGATETGLICQHFIRSTDAPAEGVVPVGRATADMEVSLLDASGRPVGPGAVGEICVSSRYLALGYWRRPELTRERFREEGQGGLRSYRSGDLGRLRADGSLEHLGRKDFEVRVRGERVELEAVEEALLALPQVREAAVAGRASGSGENRLVAYLAMQPGAKPAIDGLRRRLADSLPATAIPARYELLDALPLDANGKLDRKALPRPGRERPPLSVPFSVARNATEDLIAHCLGEVLELDRVGIHDDFFDLGGDSIQALEVALRVERELGVTLPPTALAAAPSIAELGDWIVQRHSDAARVQLAEGGPGAPLFCLPNYEGHALEHRALARHLGGERPVCGLQSRGLRLGRRPPSSVGAMAAWHVDELLRVRPRGAFLLLGNCFGGLLAFEVARRLAERGREVGLLALVDTACPPAIRVRQPVGLRLRARGLRVRLRLWRSRGRVPRYADLIVLHRLAESRYRPGGYAGAATLFCAGEPRNQRGWERWVGGGLETVVLPEAAPHETTHLMSEPHVARLARALAPRLHEAEGA